MNKIFCLIACVLSIVSCNSKELEKSDLIGTWGLSKVEMNGKVFFDRDDPSVTANNYFELVGDFYGELSEVDSAELTKKAQASYDMNKKMFYHFTQDSIFLIYSDTVTIERGTYSFDFDTQEVTGFLNASHTSGNVAQKTVFRIKGRKLIIHREFKKGKEVNIQEYIKTSEN